MGHSLSLTLCLLALVSCGRATDNSRSQSSATEGKVDSVFYDNFGTGFNGLVSAVAPTAASRIWVAGDFEKFKSSKASRLARITTAGQIDETLRRNLGEGFTGGMVRALLPLADGSLIVGGDFTNFNGTSVPHLAKLSTDGALDTTFNSNLTGGANDSVYALALEESGNLLIGGSFSHFASRPSRGIARISSSGNLDTTFSNAIGDGGDEVYTIAVLSDGSLVVGGKFTKFNDLPAKNIVKLTSAGSFDSTYASTASAAFNDSVFALAIDANSHWVAAGSFSLFGSLSAVRFMRLQNTGVADTTYTVSGGGFNGTVRTLLPQSDGKLVVGGDFTTVGGSSRAYLTRLSSDLSVDESFQSTLGTGPGGAVYALGLDSDGGLIVGGNFTCFNSAVIGNLVRLK